MLFEVGVEGGVAGGQLDRRAGGPGGAPDVLQPASGDDGQGPYFIKDTQETKTTWHPIGG